MNLAGCEFLIAGHIYVGFNNDTKTPEISPLVRP
jgi:hypothetical protein